MLSFSQVKQPPVREIHPTLTNPKLHAVSGLEKWIAASESLVICGLRRRVIAGNWYGIRYVLTGLIKIIQQNEERPKHRDY